MVVVLLGLANRDNAAVSYFAFHVFKLNRGVVDTEIVV
jgi:hypothetical protein